MDLYNGPGRASTCQLGRRQGPGGRTEWYAACKGQVARGASLAELLPMGHSRKPGARSDIGTDRRQPIPQPAPPAGDLSSYDCGAFWFAFRVSAVTACFLVRVDFLGQSAEDSKGKGLRETAGEGYGRLGCPGIGPQ